MKQEQIIAGEKDTTTRPTTNQRSASTSPAPPQQDEMSCKSTPFEMVSFNKFNNLVACCKKI
jgi:hypothetical protein